MRGTLLYAGITGFLIGVLVRSLVPIEGATMLFIGTLSLAAYAYGLLSGTVARTLPIALALLACALGAARMDASLLRGHPLLDARLGERVVVEGVIVSEPDVREHNVRLTVEADFVILDGPAAVSARLLVIAPAYTDVALGSRIRAEGTLTLPESFDTAAGREFNYPLFLGVSGIVYELSFAEVERLEGDLAPALFPKAAAVQLKHLYLDGLRKVLPEPAAGLAGGITVGDKRSVGDELSDIFREVSLVHIIVLSGYNITIVIAALHGILGALPRSPRYILLAGMIIFIVLMAGGAASALRAGAMALIALYARAGARVFHALRVLALVAFLMLVWNPWYLAFDPGFQLSMLATVGLILFTPLVERWCGFVTTRFGLREIVSATLGTQIAVLPLLLYQSGALSMYALPANMLALIAVPLAMLFSLIAAIGGAVLGTLAVPLALPAYALLSYIIAVAEFFASLPFSSLTLPAFSALWMIAAYALLFGGYLLLMRKKNGTP